MRRRLPRAVAALASLLIMLVPAARAAEPALPGGPVNAYIHAKATNGYSVQLKSEGDRLQMTVSRGLFPALLYTFGGRVSAAGIHAKIADLGVIDLRFEPSGKVRQGRPPGNCSGPRATQLEGNFIGEFDFRAERDVAEVHLAQVKGSLAAPGWRCHRESIEDFLQGVPDERTYTFLSALDSDRHLGFTAFTAVDPEHPELDGEEISASARTHRGALTVEHLAVALARNALSFDSALTSATVDPPRPFTGTATFCRTCEAASRWTGDLRVLLPGIGPPVKLTGSRYDASLKSFAGGGGSE